MKKSCCAVLLLFTLTQAKAQVTVGSWVPIFKGIDHATGLEITSDSRRVAVNVMRIDLTDPDVKMFTDPPCTNCSAGFETRGYTTSRFVKTYGVQVAVNANFYDPCCSEPEGAPFDVIGLVISKGRVVSQQESAFDSANVMFTTNNQVTMMGTNWPPAGTNGIYTAVSGHYALLTNGVNIGNTYINDPTDPTIHQPQPRTAVGVSQDGRYLYLMTIDGRYPNSNDGAKDAETADWLLRFGAYNGINLDGGGSTTMVMADCAGNPIQLNVPIDAGHPGQERVIGNHLGVFAKPLPGFINDVVVTPGNTTATISWTTISNATTQVDYGATTNYDSTVVDPTPATNHVVTLTGLSPGANYFFRATSIADGTPYIDECYFSTTNTLTVVFDLNKSWKYNTNNLGNTNWQARTYNDATWTGPGTGAGPGLLYIETSTSVSPRNTPLPGTSGALPLTYYFRTHFTPSNSSPIISLNFSNFVDDGAVFYLNGTEIYRLRMPAKPAVITYTTLTTASPCLGDATCPDVFTITGDLLTNLLSGDNVLAAEVHQVTVTSSDIVFGSALFYETSGVVVSNNPPVLTVPSAQSINELATLTVTNTATDPDGLSQTLIFSLVSGPPNATLDAVTGVFTWTPTEAQGPGNYSITIRVTDNGSPPLSDTKSFNVAVKEVNRAPVLTVPSTQMIDELATLTVTNTATDADIPANTLTFALVSAPLGVNLDAGTGVLTWMPTEAEGPGTYLITLRVFDNGSPSLSATQSFSVNVREVNVAPVLDPIGDKTVNEGNLLTFTATATDADLPANVLTFSLDPGAPSGAGITAGGAFSWTPPAGFSPATNNVTVRVTDNGSPVMSDAKSFKIVIVSAPRILEISESPEGIITITWQSFPGKKYQMEYKHDLSDATWTPVGGVVTATGSTAFATDPVGTNTQRIYHVVQTN